VQADVHSQVQPLEPYPLADLPPDIRRQAADVEGRLDRRPSRRRGVGVIARVGQKEGRDAVAGVLADHPGVARDHLIGAAGQRRGQLEVERARQLQRKPHRVLQVGEEDRHAVAPGADQPADPLQKALIAAGDDVQHRGPQSRSVEA